MVGWISEGRGKARKGADGAKAGLTSAAVDSAVDSPGEGYLTCRVRAIFPVEDVDWIT